MAGCFTLEAAPRQDSLCRLHVLGLGGVGDRTGGGRGQEQWEAGLPCGWRDLGWRPFPVIPTLSAHLASTRTLLRASRRLTYTSPREGGHLAVPACCPYAGDRRDESRSRWESWDDGEDRLRRAQCTSLSIPTESEGHKKDVSNNVTSSSQGCDP